MEKDKKNEPLQPEAVVQESVEALEKKKSPRVKRPMARWQKIAMMVSLLLCVAALVTAACLWAVGKPSLLQEVERYFRLAKFGAVSACALGITALFNGIVTLNWRTLWRVLLAVLGGILLALGLFLSASKWWSKRMLEPVWEESVQMEEEPEEEEVEVTPHLPPVQQVQNIALFGIDQTSGSVGRSDALLILSIDRTNNKIKLTSLDRDSLVAIDGHGEEKLTHAWAYGHHKLALKTINQNFGMNITDYVYINFTEFVSAIDYLGGVYVDVSAAERDHLNKAFNPKYKYFGAYVPRVEQTGLQKLNGTQALGYSRNRSDGTGQRASRQREVLAALLDQVKKQPFGQQKDTLGRLAQLCHTTLDFDEIWELGMWVLEESPTMEELSLPTSELKAWSGVLDRQRGWVRVYDLEAATAVLHNFIYETDKELPSSSEGDTTRSEDADKTSAHKTEKPQKTTNP